MHGQSQSSLSGLLIGVAVVLAIVVGVIAVLWIRPSGERGSGLPQHYEYDLKDYKQIDPALIHYQQTAEIPVGMKEPRAVATGPEDRIYVAGDLAVVVFSPEGVKTAEIALDAQPRCLAVGGAEHRFPGRIYAGMKDHVEVYDPDGTRLASWDSLGQQAVLTSIALAETDVFLADAGGRIVWRCDTSGKTIGRIGQRDEDRNIRGFTIPSPYFDVAVAPDGLLRAVNPGARRIEAYTFDGHLELHWGKALMGIEGFCGCCNPANMALLGDGRVVTAEKGIPRVKVYGATGDFECVVAGPKTLAPTPTATEETRSKHRLKVVDVATDGRGRILVLDPEAGLVRIFQHKTSKTEVP